MRSLRLAVLLLVAGCTARNPDYAGAGGGADLLGTPPPDLASAVLDLSGPMGACSAGDRRCAGTVASDRCEGGMFVLDRTCPKGSQCMNAYCAPPPPMPVSEVGQRCDTIGGGPQQIACTAQSGLSCQPFVVPGTDAVRWYCAGAVGTFAAGIPCTQGSQCPSGFCTNGTCFEACQQAGPGSGCALRCVSVDLVVEGVKVSAKSCMP